MLCCRRWDLFSEHSSALQKNLGSPKPEYPQRPGKPCSEALSRSQRPTEIIESACGRIAKASGTSGVCKYQRLAQSRTPDFTDFLRRNLGPDSQHRPLQSGEVGLPSPHAFTLYSQAKFCHSHLQQHVKVDSVQPTRLSNAAWCRLHDVLSCSTRGSHRSPRANDKLKVSGRVLAR